MADGETEILLQFLYCSPVAVVEVFADGKIGLMNPRAVSLMGDIHGEILDAIFNSSYVLWQEIESLCTEFPYPNGEICRDRHLQATSEEGEPFFLTFTISKLDAARYFVCFDDVTEKVRLEEEFQQFVSQTLHDMGNALAGVGATVGRLVADNSWEEVEGLTRLLGLFSEKQKNLDDSLGAGKGKSLCAFVQSLLDLLEDRKQTLQKDSTTLARGISHAEDILTLHRAFAKSSK